MKTQTFSLFQQAIDSISQYVDKKALIRQLESLSDHELKDAGIARGSIPSYVQAVYRDNKPAETAKQSGNRVLSPKHFASNECADC